MPINALFQEKYLPQVKALHNQYLTLSPQRIRDKVIVAHHSALLAQLRMNHVYRSPFERHQFSEAEHLEYLENILANNWQKFKTTLCGYTALPESQVTLLLCDIAMMLGQITGKKPIHLLMPGVSTESILDGIPSLEEMDLKTVLKTHIVSDSGNYLYPVTSLRSLACESDLASQKIPNPYYDYNFVTENEEKEGFIPPAALARMLNHSLDTQALLDAKARYQRMIKPTNLLGQLQLLIKTLRMNSVSGIGEEEQAGSRAYAGIISFNDYYQTLSYEQKSRIPEDLKDEIELLLALSGSKEQNDKGTQTLQTCINVRQSELEFLTKMYEAILINIGVDEQSQSELIKKAREDFELTRNQIQTKCMQGTYVGEDKLAISRKLVDEFKLAVEITTRAEMRDFLSFSANEIKSLLQTNQLLRGQLRDKLNNFDELVLFSTQTPIAQMKIVLHFVANLLPKPNCSQLSLWLAMLDLKRFKVVFNVYRNTVLRSSGKLKEILKALSDEKRDIVFAECENVIPKLIITGMDIYPTFKYLSQAQRTKIYEVIKDKIPSMIQNASEFYSALELLTLEQQKAMYHEMKDRIPKLVLNGYDIPKVIALANDKDCKDILASLKPRLNELITTCKHLKNSLFFLSVENRSILFDLIKDRTPELITRAKDVGYVFQYLSNSQSIFGFEKIKDKLPELIQSPIDISHILKRLSIEQCNMMLDTLKCKLATVVLNTSDLSKAITDLDMDQLRIVLTSLPPRWTENAAIVGELLGLINDWQRLVLIEMIKEKLPSLIQNANNFVDIFKYLTHEDRGNVLSMIVDIVPSLIQTVDDFILVSGYLGEVDKDKVKSFDKAMIEKLISVINTCDDLGKILQLTNPRLAERQYVNLIDSVKHKMSIILKSFVDVGKLLNFVEPQRRPALLLSIIKSSPHVINAADDTAAAHLLSYFDLENNPEVLATILPRLIHSARSFCQAFEYLKQEQRNELFAAMKDRLPGLIKNADNVSCVLLNLNAEQFAIILDAIKDQLPELFKTVEEVNNLTVNQEKRALIIAALEKVQASKLATIAPTFLPQKRLRVGHREMDSLRHNLTFSQPRERNEPKRQRISRS